MATLEAWYIDPSKLENDLRSTMKYDENKPVSTDYLQKLGIEYYPLDGNE